MEAEYEELKMRKIDELLDVRIAGHGAPMRMSCGGKVALGRMAGDKGNSKDRTAMAL